MYRINLEEGKCEATKTLEPGKPDTVIKEYSVGDYFGERALIKGEPRACNIIAVSDTVKVISLDRISFKRLLGPIEELLKRNIDKYQNIDSSKYEYGLIASKINKDEINKILLANDFDQDVLNNIEASSTTIGIEKILAICFNISFFPVPVGP